MSIIIHLVIIPLIVYVVARKVAAHYRLRTNNILLLTACILFSVSVLLPSPLIHGEQTEFFTHFWGGGMFVGLIWAYLKPLFPAKKWYHDLLWIYALTCTLGVLNELYELFVYEIGLNPKPVTDTSWDLLANTLGMVVFYGIYRGILLLRKLFFSR